MSFQKYLDMMKDIHENILNYLEEETKTEENFHILKDKFINTKIGDSQYDLLSLLHLISNISENHHRGPNFFRKIDQILKSYQKEINENFSNFSVFNIFKKNKRIILFLLKEKILIPEKTPTNVFEHFLNLHATRYNAKINVIPNEKIIKLNSSHVQMFFFV